MCAARFWPHAVRHLDIRRGFRVLAAVLVVALAAVVTPGPAAAADVTGRPDLEAIEAFVTSQLDRHRIPGATLAVIDGGAVVRTAAVGDAAEGEPMTADEPMPIGSVTKTFTAVAVLQLVERGRLALDAPVRDYLPWFSVDDPSASAEITIRHLLNQTSGLSEGGYNRVLAEETSLEDGVRDLRRARPTAEVGSRHQYFNPNYAVLALVVENVSGQSYGTYLADHVLEPLGMVDTYAEDPRTVGGTIAQGHRKMFGYPVAVQHRYDRWRVGADGVISTAPDLARLAIALSGDGAVDGARILNRRSVELMWTSHDVAGDPYGFGWVTGEHAGARVGGHAGADPAFSAELAVLPDQDRGYVLLMNSDHLLDLMVAVPQLRVGMLDLLQGRAAPAGGLSMATVGAATLLLTLVAAAFAVRSARKVRGWTDRASAMSTRQLFRAVAPQFLVPALVWLAVYQLSPVLTDGRAFNLGYVGRYYVPDLVILLAVATVPDVVQGVYMLVSAMRVRHRSPPSVTVVPVDAARPVHSAR
ncbi:MAG TPA: serine hydrolase domain-containing protein [Nocardioidaceae bacterium]